MPLSDDEYSQLVRRMTPVMHDIVRSYILKHGIEDEPESNEVFDWIYDSIRGLPVKLSSEQRDCVAGHCYRSIRIRMSAAQHGGCRDFH